MKKVLKIKEKEFHNSQTKIDNLEDTLAKNKVEKTELVREVSNLKKSVKRRLGKLIKYQNWPKIRRRCQKKLPRILLKLGKNLKMWKKL